MLNDSWPQSFSGDLLWGDKAVRFVFMDEAGTSEEEPATIVTGLIVNADKQLMFAERAIMEAMEAIPLEFRGEPFHAMSIWGDPKYRTIWGMTDRLNFLLSMMELPRRLEIPVTFGMIRRSADPDYYSNPVGNLTKSQWQHAMAFGGCIAQADRYIREYAELGEVATAVAEDVPEMRANLQKAALFYREKPLTLPPGSLQHTEEDKARGYTTQKSEFRVSRIRKNVHFVGKSDELVLFLADACAFGLRRYFAEQEHGETFVQAVLGKLPNREDFSGPSSYSNNFGHEKKR